MNTIKTWYLIFSSYIFFLILEINSSNIDLVLVIVFWWKFSFSHSLIIALFSWLNFKTILVKYVLPCLIECSIQSKLSLFWHNFIHLGIKWTLGNYWIKLLFCFIAHKKHSCLVNHCIFGLFYQCLYKLYTLWLCVTLRYVHQKALRSVQNNLLSVFRRWIKYGWFIIEYYSLAFSSPLN